MVLKYLHQNKSMVSICSIVELEDDTMGLPDFTYKPSIVHLLRENFEELGANTHIFHEFSLEDGVGTNTLRAEMYDKSGTGHAVVIEIANSIKIRVYWHNKGRDQGNHSSYEYFRHLPEDTTKTVKEIMAIALAKIA